VPFLFSKPYFVLLKVEKKHKAEWNGAATVAATYRPAPRCNIKQTAAPATISETGKFSKQRMNA
jgi:hypothetical protein